MYAIHPNARTTPAMRADIARSREPSGVLAHRYGVSTETIRKWRKRGPEDCQDRSARPHTLPWKASEKERAIVCALRRSTGFSLDDLTFAVTHVLPHLNHDAVYRILKAEGLNRLPPAHQPHKPYGEFKEYEVGFLHMDVKHLPSCAARMDQPANATCTSPSIAPRASCISRSRTTRRRRQPSPSWMRPSQLCPSGSCIC